MKKYYFINKFDTNYIIKQDKSTAFIYRNYNSKNNLSTILKLKNFLKKNLIKNHLNYKKKLKNLNQNVNLMSVILLITIILKKL